MESHKINSQHTQDGGHHASADPDQEHLTHPKYRPDIDGLRAFAILSVVTYHAFPNMIPGGFVGVDIFFIISGYLISTIIFQNLKRDSFSFVEFYSRRIRRIMPSLLLVMVCTYALGWYVLLPDEYKQLGKHMTAGIGFVSNLVLWNESGYFDNIAETKPLLHLWSLGIEEQFYIFWPLLLWFLWKLKARPLAIIAAIALASFTLNVLTVKTDAVAAFYSPLSRFWELLIGASLAYLAIFKQNTLRKLKIGDANLQSFLGVSLLAIGLILITKDRFFPGFWALLPTIGTVLIIAAGANAWPNRAILANRAFVWIGLISYPLYLWHWPILAFARIYENGTPPAGIRIAGLLLASGLAWLTYHFVEGLIRHGGRRRAKLAGLTFISIAVAFIGLNTYNRDGLGFRLQKIMPEIMGPKDNHAEEWRAGTCFIEKDGIDKFAASCTENNKKPLLFLWGDSHAASLYPGLKSLQQGGNFAIAQYTAALCKPELGLQYSGTDYCRANNEKIISLIKTINPQYVILHARWTDKPEEFTSLGVTVSQLKAMGIRNIVLIGPSPIWNDELARIIFSYYRKEHKKPPMLSKDCNIAATYSLDRDMQYFARAKKITYISLADVLYSENGCLVRTSEESRDLISFDSDHLTPQAAKFVVGNIFPKILRP